MKFKVGDYVFANNHLDKWNDSHIFDYDTPYRIVEIYKTEKNMVLVSDKNTKAISSSSIWNILNPIPAEFTQTKLWKVLNE